jgi:hypothetical protein
MITKLLTSLVTRDVEAFVTFVERLRDKLDALVVRHASDIGKVQAYIDDSKSTPTKKIARLKIDSDRRDPRRSRLERTTKSCSPKPRSQDQGEDRAREGRRVGRLGNLTTNPSEK